MVPRLFTSASGNGTAWHHNRFDVCHFVGIEYSWSWMKFPMSAKKNFECVICRWTSQIRRSVCALVCMQALSILHFIQIRFFPSRFEIKNKKARLRIGRLGSENRTNREV